MRMNSVTAGIALLITSSLFGANVDSGYVRFQTPDGWIARRSQDSKIIRLEQEPDGGLLIEIVMDKDLPTGLPQLGARMGSLVRNFVWRNLPQGSVQISKPCNPDTQARFSKWKAVSCKAELTVAGATADLLVAGVPLGGEVYVISFLVPSSQSAWADLKPAATLLESTIHFWTENVDAQSPTARHEGNESLSLSAATLMGTWSGMANFRVWESPIERHNERNMVTITFSAGNRYSYAALGASWNGFHSGTFTLAAIPNVPNAYEYSHILTLTPSAGTDRTPMTYRARLGSMTNALQLQPTTSVRMHDAREQEQFQVERSKP